MKKLSILFISALSLLTISSLSFIQNNREVEADAFDASSYTMTAKELYAAKTTNFNDTVELTDEAIRVTSTVVAQFNILFQTSTSYNFRTLVEDCTSLTFTIKISSASEFANGNVFLRYNDGTTTNYTLTVIDLNAAETDYIDVSFNKPSGAIYFDCLTFEASAIGAYVDIKSCTFNGLTSFNTASAVDIVTIYGWNHRDLENGTYSTLLQYDADFGLTAVSNTNYATQLADKVTLNGVPFSSFANSRIDHQHGNRYLQLVYPEEAMATSIDYPTPILEIKEGTFFEKTILTAVRLSFDGSAWSIVEEETPKDNVAYTGIAPGWNNSHYGDNLGYNQLILCFGTHNVDFLARDHAPNSVNQAKQEFDIGNKLTINGIPIYKINNRYSKTHVGYDHGYAFFYIQYPVEVLQMNKNNVVPTIHIEAGATFMDSILPEVTLKFNGGCWIYSDVDELILDNPSNIDLYTLSDVTYPHQFGTTPHPIFNDLPAEGCKIAFNINTGNFDTTNLSNAVNLDGIYGCTVSVYLSTGTIKLLDKEASGAEVQSFTGFSFTPNADYSFEFDVSCASTTTYKVAINHCLVINYTFSSNKSASRVMWVVDTTGELVMDYYKETTRYVPNIGFGGSSYYDFIEGDPVYDFASVVNAFDLYDDSVSSADVTFEYEEGAVTDNKYNAGVWTLTITLTTDSSGTATKVVTINVHGKTSVAKIYYDDAEPIEVPIGSKLVPPPNPDTYRDGDYDYVFDGWYFEGAKWDFENDVVEGDMHLESRFVPVMLHYIVTVHFEGLARNTETYSITKGSYLPFDLFDLEGATFEVFSGEQKISSLQVMEDVEITVKYTIIFTYVEAKEATCTKDGNVGYWYSPVYANYYFADSRGRELIDNPFIPKLNHDIVHLNYQDSTCHEVGHVECYYCNNCHKHFEDENAEHELENWAIEKKPHVLTHHSISEATCDENGNVEYWTCENEPGVYYGDENCTFTLDDVVIEAIGHDYRSPTYTWKEINGVYQCVASIKCTNCDDEISEINCDLSIAFIKESTCSEEGQISYTARFNNPAFSAQTKIVKLAKTEHTYVHYEEVKATENRDGVKEHYECSECHKCFIKDGDNYTEVQYTDLFYKFNGEEKKACGGNVATTSLTLFILTGMSLFLVQLRRKEEN